MNDRHDSGRRFINYRYALGLVLLPFVAGAHAQAGLDLVAHNGFEACWSQAMTPAQFYDLQQSSIEGAVFCMPQSSAGNSFNGYSVCNKNLCPGAATGCPVTIHSGTFNGNLSNGPATLDASGTADDITIDATCKVVGIAGSCTLTVSNVSFGYSLNYTLQPDGNNGLYAVSLDQASMVLNDGYTFPDCTCTQLMDKALILSTTESPGSVRIAELEVATSIGESVCPLTP